MKLSLVLASLASAIFDLPTELFSDVNKVTVPTVNVIADGSSGGLESAEILRSRSRAASYASFLKTPLSGIEAQMKSLYPQEPSIANMVHHALVAAAATEGVDASEATLA